jgi:hypothetical protein
MLRKLAWTALLALLVFVARKAASRIWKTTTGEEPPVKA